MDAAAGIDAEALAAASSAPPAAPPRRVASPPLLAVPETITLSNSEKELLAKIQDPQKRAQEARQMLMQKHELLATVLSNLANMREMVMREMGIAKVLGLTLSGITPELKKRFSLAEPSNGVIVVKVAKDSEAAAKGVRPGDIITDAGQEKVSSPADLSNNVDEAKKNGRNYILLSVKREDDLRFVLLRPD